MNNEKMLLHKIFPGKHEMKLYSQQVNRFNGCLGVL